MSSKRKEISSGERQIIVKLWKDGKTYREIGKIVGRTHSSIQRVVKSYQSTGEFAPKPRSGRPPKLTTREIRYIIQCVRQNPKITSSKIAQDIEERFHKTICSDTVCKILKKMDIVAVLPVKSR